MKKSSWWDSPSYIRSISKQTEFINRIRKIKINDLYLKYDINKFKTEASNNTKLNYIINRDFYDKKIEINYILLVLLTLQIIIYKDILSNSKLIKHKDYTYFKLARINNELKYIKLITPAITENNSKSKQYDSSYDEDEEDEEEDKIDVFNRYTDSLIYDSITGYIFEKLNKKYNNKFNLSFLTKYDYSFVSVCKVKNDIEKTTYWDYNEINNIILSNNERELEKYNNICWIIVYDSIKGNFKSIIAIFKSIIENAKKKLMKDKIVRNKVIGVIKKLILLNDFLVFIGLKYGYLHNDLHLENILYDSTNDIIKMIDYGRNFFGYYYNNRDNEIDNYTKGLNKYLLTTEFVNLDSNINTYKDLYMNDFMFCKSLIVNINGNYPTIILDLITMGLNIYYNLKMVLLSNYGINDNIYKEVINNCEKLFVISEIDLHKLQNYKTKIGLSKEIIKFYMDNKKNKNRTLDKLVEIYISLKDKNKQPNEEIIEYKEIIDYLLDISFYTAIVFIAFDEYKLINLNNNDIFYTFFQFNKFNRDGSIEIEHIYKSILYLNQNYLILSDYNIYFNKLNKNNNHLSLSSSSLIQGGKSSSKKSKTISDKTILNNYKKYLINNK